MTDTQRRGLVRIAAVAVITIAAVYLFQLAGLALATRQARRVEARHKAEVAALATQVVALETAVVTAGSDAQVERWARDRRDWSRPGDHVLAPTVGTAVPVPATPQPEAQGNAFERFWRWLRGR